MAAAARASLLLGAGRDPGLRVRKACKPRTHKRVVACGHMRERIGIRELRDTLTGTIRRVRNGETLEVTHDGVPVAILSPMPSDRIQRLVAGGDVTPPSPIRPPLRRYPVTGGRTAGEAIEEDRAER